MGSAQSSILQDAIGHALKSLPGGVDRHGRETSFTGHGYEKGGVDYRSRKGHALYARVLVRRAGFSISNGLSGEKLVAKIDQLAHSIGYDAYTEMPLDRYRAEYGHPPYNMAGGKHRRR